MSFALLVGISPALLGQEPSPIKLPDLPPPPDEIAALIQSHQVTLEAGEKAESSPPAPSQLSAETRFHVDYKYQCRSRWTLDPGSRKLVVRMRFSRISWQPKHRIWFRRQPASEGFWTDPLVLHEFDHVRISGDSRIATRFKELLVSRNTLDRTVDVGDVVNHSYVDRLVEQHVADLFAEMKELISIRYRELDRVTGHGLRPLPADSVIHQWLQADADAASR